MLEFTNTIKPMPRDGRRFTKTMDRILGQIIREAAREWLRAVLKSVNGSFPVWSGAAKMTLVPLGRFLHNVGGLSVSPVSGAPDRRSMGEQNQQFNIKDGGDGSFEYSFEWSNDVLHYYINEYYQIPFIASSPWHSIEAGEAAMSAYIEQALANRLPDIDFD